MRKTAYIFLLILIFSTSLLVQSVFGYYNAEHNFSITPPSGWTTEEQEGILVVMFIDYSQYLGASINIAVEETRAISLLQYVEINRIPMETTFDDFVVISEGSRVITGRDCYELVFTYTYWDEELKMKQFYFLEGGKGYVIGCGCHLSDYVSLLWTFENCVDTFRIGDTSFSASDNNLLIIGLIIAVVVLAIAVLVTVMFLKRKKTEPPILTNQMSEAQVTEVSIGVTTTPRFCRFCGAETKTDTVFCENCGKRVSD